jgi:hypothetical protein
MAHSDEKYRDLLAYIMILCAVLAAYGISKIIPIDEDGRLNYWLGVAGTSVMAVLFTYPLRKRLKKLRSAGTMKGWLKTHMVLGILGPSLILLHSKFSFGSTNAAVALWSMILVVCSGIAGRFLYRHAHYDLHAELKALEEFNVHDHPELKRIPEAVQILSTFEKKAMAIGPSATGHWLSLVFVLSLESWVVRFRTARLIQDSALKKFMVQHLTHVMRVSLFKAWERLFAQWHVIHIPFLFSLLITTILHIWAVHVY